MSRCKKNRLLRLIHHGTISNSLKFRFVREECHHFFGKFESRFIGQSLIWFQRDGFNRDSILYRWIQNFLRSSPMSICFETWNQWENKCSRPHQSLSLLITLLPEDKARRCCRRENEKDWLIFSCTKSNKTIDDQFVLCGLPSFIVHWTAGS